MIYGEEENSDEEEEKLNLEREYPPHLPSRPSSGINVTTQREGFASIEQLPIHGTRQLSNCIIGENSLACTLNGIGTGSNGDQREDGWDTFKPVRRKSPASASNLVPLSAMPLLDRPKHTVRLSSFYLNT